MASRQQQPSPRSSAEWEAAFRETLLSDLQAHDDPAVVKLLADRDNTFEMAAAHVRRYVTDFWKTTNEDRSLFGAELRQKLLPSALAGQKTTAKLYDTLIARVEEGGFDAADAILTNCRQHKAMTRELLTHLEYIRDHVADAFNTKPLGYAGDLQTLDALDSFLRVRLAEYSFGTLATLLDCGYTVEGIDKDVNDPKNLQHRLEAFRRNKPQLAADAEAAARAIPHGKPRQK